MGRTKIANTHLLGCYIHRNPKRMMTPRFCGSQFFAARLDANLVVKGNVVIPAGSKVYGRVESSESAGRAFGQSKLALSLRKIVVEGRPVPIATGSYEQVGPRSGRKTARRTAAGALVGFAAGGPAVGAAIGAATGLIGKGKSVEAPAGTLFEFRLTRPVSV